MMARRVKSELRPELTQQAFEHLSLQMGSERAWRLAFEMELRWRKAEAKIAELRKEIARLEHERHGRRVRRLPRRKRGK